jgi:hypothetical protein
MTRNSHPTHGNEHLGKKGEARFTEICNDAELACNPSTGMDKTGWDFVVEFPTRWDEVHSLEQSPTAISCFVQVKTILDSTETIKIPVRAATYMATEPKPFFVYVFKVNSEKNFTAAYLIHVFGETLGRILKSLRAIDQKPHPRGKSENQTITLSVEKLSTRLDITGVALRKALEEKCGPDMHAYIRAKEKQNGSLGFEERSYRGQFTLQPESADELADIFLGVKKNVPVKNLHVVRRRFGIEGPVEGRTGASDGTISITPSLFDTCTITAYGAPGTPSALFPARVYLPATPAIPRASFKVLYDADLFQIVQSATEATFEFKAGESPRTLPEWVAYWRFQGIIARGEGSLEIASDTKGVRGTMDIAGLERSTVVEAECRYWLSVAEQAQAVLQYLGVSSNPKVSEADLREDPDRIRAAYLLSHPGRGAVTRSFKTPAAALPEDPYELDVVYAEVFRLGEITVGFYGLGRFIGQNAGESIVWKTNNVVLRRMSPLKSLPDDYMNMIETAKRETGIQAVMSRTIDEQQKK